MFIIKTFSEQSWIDGDIVMYTAMDSSLLDEFYQINIPKSIYHRWLNGIMLVNNI